MKNKPIAIGTYGMGCLNVKVEADLGLEGGHYDMDKSPTITVGLLYNQWGSVVGILLHEAMEMSMMLHGCKSRRVPMVNHDSSDCTFTMNHPDYARVCAEVGYFMGDCLPDLATVFNKHCKKKGKKGKKC